MRKGQTCTTLGAIRGFLDEQISLVHVENRLLTVSISELKRPVRYFWSLHDFVRGLRGALLGMYLSHMSSSSFMLIQSLERTRIPHEDRDSAPRYQREQHCSRRSSVGRERIFDRLRHGHTADCRGTHTSFIDSIWHPTASIRRAELYQARPTGRDEARQRVANGGYICNSRIPSITYIIVRVPFPTFLSTCFWARDTLISMMWNRSCMCLYYSFSPTQALFLRWSWRMPTIMDLFDPSGRDVYPI